MNSRAKLAVVVTLFSITISACSSGSDQTSTEAPTEESTSEETVVAEENQAVEEAEAAPETTLEESQSEVTSDTVATEKIGYGHWADSVYLEQVRRNMNGSQQDQFSEAQLFNYARNTCTKLRAGNWQEMIDFMKGQKGTSDYQFVASMTMLAIYAYCPESENPFFEEAKKLGL
jgi:hypothetical protein